MGGLGGRGVRIRSLSYVVMRMGVFLVVDVCFKAISCSLSRTVAWTKFDHRRNSCGTDF